MTPLRIVEATCGPSRSLSLEIDMEDSSEQIPLDSEIDPALWELFPQLPRDLPPLPVWDTSTLRRHTRLDLPMRIYGTTITARPDSGCEDNIIDAKTIGELGLYVDRSIHNKKTFQVANGRVVTAVGVASVPCYFPNEPWRQLHIELYVFPRLVTPMIVGLSFLDDTRTLTENRHRFQPRKLPRSGPFRVSRLNRPKRWLKCLVNSAPVLVNPDTGSDIDLMSLAYAKQRDLQLQPVEMSESVVEFADGSIARLSGKLVATVTLCSDELVTEEMIFYVLENLTCDVLLGEEFVQSREIFQQHISAFTTNGMETSMLQANTILWQKKAETQFLRFFSGGKKEENALPASTFGQNLSGGMDLEANRHEQTSVLDHDNPASGSPADKRSLAEDARELHRREENANNIAKMVGLSKEMARSEEEARILGWETRTTTFDQHLHLPPRIGSVTSTELQVKNNQRQFLGTQPKSTQSQPHILRGNAPNTIPTSSQTAVQGPAVPQHSTPVARDLANRPHFCPFSYCPRSSRGTNGVDPGFGFRTERKMQMHLGTHAPGYICPFCPDNQRVFPRPDNLQRHVRVHHVDKNKDDPKLRSALAHGRQVAPAGPAEQK